MECRKRTRDAEDALPDSKRIQSDLLLTILCEEEDSVGDPAADHELATVIRSLEEEIAVPPAMIPPEKEEIAYLQEASDHELGIPPPAGDDCDEEAKEGFGRIWGFEDDGIPAWFEGFVGFRFLTEEDYGDDAGAALLSDTGFGDGLDLVRRPASMHSL